MKELENNSMDDEIVSIESQTEEKTEAAAEDAEISFEDLGLDEQTLAAIEKKGFKVPSPIQALAIPRLLSGESNMIARARTGTGKTAAFGLPIIQKLRNENGTVKALILEPTRELAMQTCTEMQSFTEGKSPRTCVLYGGASYSTQIKDLRRGTEIVVGTPGRIQDHLERGTLDISKIDYFILDEGDEMLDMGFVDDIEHIFEQANPDARILLFSATMPEEILKIAQKFMGDYEIVEEEGVIDEPLLIDQKFWILRESEKPDALVRLIDISDDFYGVVFTQTKSDADYVSRILDEKGYEAAALHGDIAQSQREKILARFRSRKTKILVATDVAARGIDISGLTHVVNYSLPFDGATYVHRIGRTGRAGSAGVAVTFVCPKETRKLGYLQKAVRKASKGEMKEEPIPTIDEVLKKKSTRIFSELKEKLGLNEQPVPSDSTKETDAEQETQDGQTVSEPAEQQELPAEQKTSAAETENGSEEKSVNDEENSKQPSKSNLIKVSSNFEKMAEDLCRGNDSQDVLAAVLSVIYSSKLDKSRYGKIQEHASSSDQTRLYIQLGRKDGYNARAIADYFSRLLHIPGRLVDRIDIASTFSLVSLPKDAAKRALDLSRTDSGVPHMHVNTKDDSFSGEGGGRKGRGGRGGFGGRGGDFGGNRGGERRGRGRSFEGREKDRYNDSGIRSKSRGSRPNYHTQTERNGSAGLFKKKGGKPERF